MTLATNWLRRITAILDPRPKWEVQVSDNRTLVWYSGPTGRRSALEMLREGRHGPIGALSQPNAVVRNVRTGEVIARKDCVAP